MPAITRRMVSDIPPTLNSYGKGDEGRGGDFITKSSLNEIFDYEPLVIELCYKKYKINNGGETMIKNFLSQKMNDILVGLLVAIIIELVKKKKEKKTLEINKNKAAMKELLPMIQSVEDKLDSLESQLISKNYDEFNQYIFKIKEILDSFSNFLDKVEKPKKIRKRLEKKNEGKLKNLTFFEEAYAIYSMLDTIVFLGYGILELKEESKDSSSAEENFEKELNKTYLIIKKLKNKYKVY